MGNGISERLWRSLYAASREVGPLRSVRCQWLCPRNGYRSTPLAANFAVVQGTFRPMPISFIVSKCRCTSKPTCKSYSLRFTENTRGFFRMSAVQFGWLMHFSLLALLILIYLYAVSSKEYWSTIDSARIHERRRLNRRKKFTILVINWINWINWLYSR